MQAPTTSIYILKYNNYYNRIVKKEEDLSTYLNYNYYGPLTGTNFVPNDGVNTKHTIGNYLQKYDGLGDYLLVVNELQEIVSRWFIIEARMVRGGQWDLTLHRDLIVDYYEPIIKADTFIEKATLNSDDPLIYNDESFTVNQIKTKETPLYDNSGCPWIIGYYPKNATSISGTVKYNDGREPNIQLTIPIEEWEFYKYTTEFVKSYPNTLKMDLLTKLYRYEGAWVKRYYNIKANVFTNEVTYEFFNGGNTYVEIDNTIGEAVELLKNYTSESYISNIIPSYLESLTLAQTITFLSLSGKTIRDSNGKFYRISIETSEEKSDDIIPSGALLIYMENMMKDLGAIKYEPEDNPEKSLKLKTTYNEYKIILTQLTGEEITYNITGDSQRVISTDSPYNMFAIPFGNIKVSLNNLDVITTDRQLAIDVATSITADNPEIYDIQVLPYCPVQELITDSKELTFQNEHQFSYIKKGNTNVGVIINVPKSRFTSNLILNIDNESSNIGKKLNNTCDKWRLTAPNYSNYFDFSVEKNNGIQYFNIDCDYKPQTPYIHINPDFKNLYGDDFNSPRGLVLGGDFSLDIIKDEWEVYKLQNKNFQNIFDRQIQNIDVQNDIQRIKDATGAITGTITGAATGALTGAMVGGSGGAIGGAIAGGVASAIGGIVDYNLNEQLRNENLDYTKDLFGYQLGNIKALPITLSKVSALNGNNKLVPILEYYTCTEREKLAFLNKVAYNGMTVMAIDKIENYIYNRWSIKGIESKGYIKGKIIRIDLEEDYHITKSIADEINKGAFFNEYSS